jgi:hypothetical protein
MTLRLRTHQVRTDTAAMDSDREVRAQARTMRVDAACSHSGAAGDSDRWRRRPEEKRQGQCCRQGSRTNGRRVRVETFLPVPAKDVEAYSTWRAKSAARQEPQGCGDAGAKDAKRQVGGRQLDYWFGLAEVRARQ